MRCDGGGWRALTCPEEQCAVHPRTSPWMAAALMARPAILHSACTGGAGAGEGAKQTTLCVSHCCRPAAVQVSSGGLYVVRLYLDKQ